MASWPILGVRPGFRSAALHAGVSRRLAADCVRRNGLLRTTHHVHAGPALQGRGDADKDSHGIGDWRGSIERIVKRPLTSDHTLRA